MIASVYAGADPYVDIVEAITVAAGDGMGSVVCESRGRDAAAGVTGAGERGSSADWIPPARRTGLTASIRRLTLQLHLEMDAEKWHHARRRARTCPCRPYRLVADPCRSFCLDRLL